MFAKNNELKNVEKKERRANLELDLGDLPVLSNTRTLHFVIQHKRNEIILQVKNTLLSYYSYTQ